MSRKAATRKKATRKKATRKKCPHCGHAHPTIAEEAQPSILGAENERAALAEIERRLGIIKAEVNERCSKFGTILEQLSGSLEETLSTMRKELDDLQFAADCDVAGESEKDLEDLREDVAQRRHKV